MAVKNSPVDLFRLIQDSGVDFMWVKVAKRRGNEIVSSFVRGATDCEVQRQIAAHAEITCARSPFRWRFDVKRFGREPHYAVYRFRREG